MFCGAWFLPCLFGAGSIPNEKEVNRQAPKGNDERMGFLLFVFGL